MRSDVALLVGFLGAMAGLWAVEQPLEAMLYLGHVLLMLSGILVGYGVGESEGYRAAKRRYLGERS